MLDKIRFLPLALLAVYLGKVLIFGARLEDSLIILWLSAASAFFFHKEQQKDLQVLTSDLVEQKRITQEYTKKLDDLKTRVEAINLALQNRRL